MTGHRDTLTDEERARGDRRHSNDHDGNEVAVCYWFREDVVESIVAARVRAAKAQALRDAADWYETPVTADNYPGFAEVLRANADRLGDTEQP